MRIPFVHFADLHIGVESYGKLDTETGLNRRVMDFLQRLDDVVEYAITHEAGAVLFAGDAFRTRDPEPTYLREFARRLRRLAQADIPLVLLAGNHDIPAMEQRATSLDIFQALDISGMTVARKPGVHRIPTRYGTLQVVALPYPVRQRLLRQDVYRRKSMEELDREVTRILTQLLTNLQAECDPQLPTVLLAHVSVEQARWGSERSIMVGRDVTLPRSALADPTWDYVALGHIHRHQDVNEGQTPPMVYPGSLERVDFGEEGQPKGFCWVEVERGHAEWRFVQVNARPFITVKVDVRAAAGDPLALVEQRLRGVPLKDAVVRLQLTLMPEQEPHLPERELNALLAPAFYAQIVREVQRTTADRLAGLEVETLTPEELLSYYLEARGKAPEAIAAYLDEARAIFNDVEERGGTDEH